MTLAEFTRDELLLLHCTCEQIADDCRLMQVPRRERGAWVRPGLAGSAEALERALLRSYDRLARDILDSLRGRSDDVTSGRFQAARGEPDDTEIAAALDAYGIPESERDDPAETDRLAAILLLILLWRQRHVAIADGFVEDLFARGYRRVHEEVGQPVSSVPANTALRAEVLRQFQDDIDRLEAGLRDGTARATGITDLVTRVSTIGAAAAFLRRLFDRERYRVEMLAEALVWSSHEAGFRAGAVDATRKALTAQGVTLLDGQSIAGLPAEVREKLPAFSWTGPSDGRTCSPCRSRFGPPVYVQSIEDLPDPAGICLGRRSCRHSWELVEG